MQTRSPQERLAERSCGFETRSRHQAEMAEWHTRSLEGRLPFGD